MNPSRQIKIQLYGALRSYSSQSECMLNIQGSESVAEVKVLLRDRLLEKAEGVSPPGGDSHSLHALLASSVLATPKALLSEKEILPAECNFAILPPVCGG